MPFSHSLSSSSSQFTGLACVSSAVSATPGHKRGRDESDGEYRLLCCTLVQQSIMIIMKNHYSFGCAMRELPGPRVRMADLFLLIDE